MRNLALVSTDWHIKEDNIELIKDLIIQKCKVAKDKGVDTMFCLGDVFDSRIAQREKILNTLSWIADYIEGESLYMWVISGNHDKTNYGGDTSFLTPFRRHPAITLVEEPMSVEMEGLGKVAFMPFYKDEVYVEKLKMLGEEYDVLFTHTHFEGSVNNDGSIVSTSIKPKLFKNFKVVYSGHYHNYQNISAKIYHLPSICQHDFGENDNKGFTLIPEDGLKFEIINSEFPKYINYVFDSSDIESKKIAKEAVKAVKMVEAGDNVRFKIEGSETALKNVDKNLLNGMGIDVKKIITSSEVEEDKPVLVGKMNNSGIVEEFENFCKKEKLDYNDGLKHLNYE